MQVMKSSAGEIPMAEPLAYFLTWPTYGTWLPGDQRGWVQYHRGHQLPDPVLEREAQARMEEEACILDRTQRDIVEKTIQDHCEIPQWKLFAVNCRSNHLHVVVGAKVHPDEIRKQLKAWATRHLKAHQKLTTGHDGNLRTNWWAERGSGRYINDEDSLEAAIIYVQEGQGRQTEDCP